MIKELNERLCDITSILSEAKKVKDQTGQNSLPYDVHADVDMTEHYLRVQEPKRLEAIELFSKAFGISQE